MVELKTKKKRNNKILFVWNQAVDSGKSGLEAILIFF